MTEIMMGCVMQNIDRPGILTDVHPHAVCTLVRRTSTTPKEQRKEILEQLCDPVEHQREVDYYHRQFLRQIDMRCNTSDVRLQNAGRKFGQALANFKEAYKLEKVDKQSIMNGMYDQLDEIVKRYTLTPKEAVMLWHKGHFALKRIKLVQFCINNFIQSISERADRTEESLAVLMNNHDTYIVYDAFLAHMPEILQAI